MATNATIDLGTYMSNSIRNIMAKAYKSVLSNPREAKFAYRMQTLFQNVKADLAIQGPGVELLMKCMADLKDDPTTYDLLKAYLKDEEEDLYWSQGAVELIEKIGTQNWLLLQL